jgi:hypothetical protein
LSCAAASPRAIWTATSTALRIVSGVCAEVEPEASVFLDVTREGQILIRRTTVPPLTSLGIIVNWSDYVKRIAGE